MCHTLLQHVLADKPGPADIQFLEELDLTWELMDNSDEYIGLTD